MCRWIRTVGTGNNNLSKSKQQYIKDAIRYYQVDRYQEAFWAFEQAIQIDPSCVKALHGRGIILTRMREYEKALEAFERALKLAPDIAKNQEPEAFSSAQSAPPNGSENQVSCQTT